MACLAVSAYCPLLVVLNFKEDKRVRLSIYLVLLIASLRSSNLPKTLKILCCFLEALDIVFMYTLSAFFIWYEVEKQQSFKI